MVCHKCGKFISESEKFCSNCGEKIDWDAEKKKQEEQQSKNIYSDEHISLDSDAAVGKGLKGLAVVYLIIGIIGFVFLGAYLAAEVDETFGIVLIIVGIISSIVNYWLFAGYGVIVDKLVKIEHNTRKR